jgi:hypothetical protein
VTDETPSPDLLALAERLRYAATTAGNDDYTKRETRERARHNERVDAMLAAAEALVTASNALEESVKLQNHYAELLNCHDCGQRMQFASGSAWIARLQELARSGERG